jgi:hypothetical protein
MGIRTHKPLPNGPAFEGWALGFWGLWLRMHIARALKTGPGLPKVLAILSFSLTTPTVHSKGTFPLQNAQSRTARVRSLCV